MHFGEYQELAQETDQVPGTDERSILIPMLGLVGEAGALVSEYKKHLRDGPAHRMFREQVSEELGDLLWYLSNVATKFDLDLDEIAAHNLAKTKDRWPTADLQHPKLYDADSPPAEQLPRQFEVELRQVEEDDCIKVQTWWNGHCVGDTLTDNAYMDDGYRFHDVFHLSYAAILGWSPLVRKLFGRKRRSAPKTDEVEDGGRAAIIEECISALVYDYARKHNYLAGVTSVDYPLLKTIRGLVTDREVKTRSLYDWERAILKGYEVWREIRENGGGIIVCDLIAGTLCFRKRESLDQLHGLATPKSELIDKARD